MTRHASSFARGYLVGIDTATPPNFYQYDYTTTNGWGTTLAAPGTYYFPFGGSEDAGVPVDTIVNALSARWSAAIAGTLSIEATNFPKTFSGFNQGSLDIGDSDTSGAWQPINIAPNGMLFAVIAGTGNTLTALTATLGGTNAGFANWNIPDIGFRRLRAKLVTSAAGFIALNAHGKLA